MKALDELLVPVALLLIGLAVAADRFLGPAAWLDFGVGVALGLAIVLCLAAIALTAARRQAAPRT